MTVAPPASTAPPEEEGYEHINRFRPSPADVQLALSGADGPFKVGDLLCRRIVFERCWLTVRIEKIVAALEREPVEVRAAAAEELAPLMKTLAEFSPYFAEKIRRRLNLPDEPVAVSEADRARASEVSARALAECATCVIDVIQFWDKFVDSAIITQDSRGRHVYLLYVKAPEGLFAVKLRKNEICGRTVFKKRGGAAKNGEEGDEGDEESSAGKSEEKVLCSIPDEVNYLLSVKLGIALYSQKDLEEDALLIRAKKKPEETFAYRQGASLLSLLETNAKPDLLVREIALRQALRELLTKGGSGAVPVLYKNTVYGRWCDDGFLYIPTKFLGEIVDAMAVRFGSRRAFVSTAQYLGLLRQPNWRLRYAPADYTCSASNPRCAHAYVFHVDALAKFLDVSEEELCGE